MRGTKRSVAVAAFVVFGLLFAAKPVRAQLVFLPNESDYQVLSAVTGSGPLEIFGRGTAELKVASPSFTGKVTLRGAQLTLSGNGQLNNPWAWGFEIENGGTLFLDNSGTAHANRIGNFSTVALNAGTIHLRGGSSGSLTQQVGQLIVRNGASTLQLTHEAGASDFTALGAMIFDLAQWGTFNLTGNRRFGTDKDFDSVRLFLDSAFGPPPFPIGEVLREGTVEGEDWVTTTLSDDGNVYFVPFEDYYTGSPNDWLSTHHVLIDGYDETVFGSGPTVEIGSLKLANGAGLVSWAAKVDFSGLLTTGGLDNAIEGGSSFTFRYAHIYSSLLSFEGWNVLTTSSLVKTGPGTLQFATNSWHTANTLYIHQGSLVLTAGGLRSRQIVIGDGAGTDALKLPANRVNPILGLPSSETPQPRLNITLKGTPYGENPDSGEFDAAILRFGGSTVQNVYQLHVEGRGTIDFADGTIGAPNQLFVEEFYLGDFWSGDFSTTTLFIRNWEDGSDFLLVRYTQSNIDRINSGYLSRIYFEDYGSPGAVWEYWSDEYWQIKPFPEPTTYGAIFGAVGLGLWAWKRRKRSTATNA